MDHHIITVVSDTEVLLEPREGMTMFDAGTAFIVRSLTPSQLVVSPASREQLVYTYTVEGGRLTGVQGKYESHDGLCAHSPCTMQPYAFAPPSPPSAPCSPVSVTLTDSWGDGWNGNTLLVNYFTGGSVDGQAQKSTVLELKDGFTKSYTECMVDALNYCIQIEYKIPQYESWPSENSWSAEYKSDTESAVYDDDGAKTLYLPLSCAPPSPP